MCVFQSIDFWTFSRSNPNRAFGTSRGSLQSRNISSAEDVATVGQRHRLAGRVMGDAFKFFNAV